MKEKIKNISNHIKEHFNKILDIAVLKEENKLLKKQVEELKINQIPLIDLKNKYLSELRAKNLELCKCKKKAENLEEELQKTNEFYKAKEIEILGDKEND